MRHVELVIFENDSIMHEKALSLPIGKVSFRQLAMMLIGILSAMVGYFITKDIIVSGVILAVFLGLGLVNTKIMSPDQMIKAYLLFLIRGTSLSRGKPENLKKKNTVTDSSKKEQTSKKRTDTIIQKKFSGNTIIYILENVFAKFNQTKSIKKYKKNHSIKIKLQDNMLKIIPTEKIVDIDFLQKQIHILLDGKETNRDRFTVTDKQMIVPLDESSNCNFSIIVDDGIEERLC